MAEAEDRKGILLESGTNEMELIELYIDEVGGYRGYYGVNVAKVLEIIRLPPVITKPPKAAPFVTGVFNHRGKVIILVDMALWLGKNRLEGGTPIVIITEFNQTTSAFLVSGITRIHRSSWASINPVDHYLQNFCDAITGLIHLEGRTVLMLDLERAISEIDPRLAMPQHLAEGAAAVASGTAAAAGLRYPLRVLHADDSGMIRRATKQLLEEKREFVVASKVDGSEAWEYLLEVKKKAGDQKKPITDFIDIVLSDVEMPQMDGYHLCQKVKNDPVLKALPVVLFSSLITDKLRHKGESVLADAQISKPNPDELIQNLKEIMVKR
ncbi:MAG: chemotaxis protein [Deltaproteobacteria bacterium]|nr:chemotaxis protein [Deltaproteobacteria bacterium]